MLRLCLKLFVQGRLEVYNVSKLHLCMDLVVAAITIADTLMHNVPYVESAITLGKIVFTTCLSRLILSVCTVLTLAFADERNVRHKLSAALTLPRTVTNNDAIDSYYFLESRIKHASK